MLITDLLYVAILLDQSNTKSNLYIEMGGQRGQKKTEEETPPEKPDLGGYSNKTKQLI